MNDTDRAGSQAPDGSPKLPRLPPLAGFDGTLARRCTESLRTAILDLRCRPGMWLGKRDICAQLGVSRSPVSEALARLAAEGLVEIRPQSGSYVARLSMEKVREGAFLREALELHAAERVAPVADAALLAALADNLAEQEAAQAAGDHPRFYVADAAFHELVLDATGFPRLARFSRTAWVHVDRARRLLLPEPGRLAATIAEHRAIHAALAARDPVAAREATRLHLGRLLAQLEPLAQERPDLFSRG
ncbi:MAG: GntR family transcriptional regulator [Rubellimicrobium sp.]|nr:GntR family transcriptional regulator [Rubellimicrobium sp.]